MIQHSRLPTDHLPDVWLIDLGPGAGDKGGQ